MTSWANGCSWNDALKISGLPPGDLVRLLSRVLDALRQLGNLPYTPIRRNDYYMEQDDERNLDSNELSVSRGIHPDIMHLCRLASKSMNRYPVKDSFMLDMNNDDNDDDEIDDQNDEDETGNDVEFQNDTIKVDVYSEQDERIIGSSPPR